MTATAGEQAAMMVAAVRDDPARRLELAARFYDRRAARPDIRPYRRAELAFMRWQISRGVLAPPNADQPGSAWWRAVNEGLLRDAWQADLLLSGQPGMASRQVPRVIRFLRGPSAKAWYGAHNTSIVADTGSPRPLRAGLPLERFFMDVALIRVLYAHSLLTAPRLALGRFAPAARLLADPRWRGADAFLSLRDILPVRIHSMDHRGGDPDRQELHGKTGRLRCDPVRAPALYGHIASELNEPRLLEMVRDGCRSTPGPCGATRLDAGEGAAADPHVPKLTGPYPVPPADPR